MATTIKAATLTVKLTEQISLNGTEQGSTNTLTIGSINEVSKRIVTVPTTEVELVAMSSAVSSGTFVTANVRYIRLTNLDDANFVVLTFKNEDNDEFALKLDYGQSFTYNADLVTGVADTTDANQQEISFTDATCDTTDESTTVTCDSSAKIAVGQSVTGTGIPTGAAVTAVNTVGAVTSFTLGAAPGETTDGAATASGTNVTLTFKTHLADLSNITAYASTAAVDLEVFVAST
tara:strand:- start:263 stop:964 length:702 start_codon:yes stop_codon:yes gene_type:complete